MFIQLSSLSLNSSGAIYHAGAPVVKSKKGISFQKLTDIKFIEGSCSLSYQLSSNNSDFYYYTGGAWTLATGELVAESSSSTVIKANINTFVATAGAGKLYFKAFMNSDSTQKCTLDKIELGIPE